MAADAAALGGEQAVSGVTGTRGVTGGILQANVFFVATPPAAAQVGDLWGDSSLVPHVWKKCTSTSPLTFVSIEGGGGGASADATYVVMSLSATLTNERVLTASSTVSVADGGAGGTATLAVPDNAITFAKLQDISAASRLLGRGSAAGAGDPEEIILGAGLTMTGTTLDTAGGGGDNIQTNGAAVTDANFNDTTPVASAGRALMLWQRSGPGPDSVSVQTPEAVPIILAREPTLITIASSVTETDIFNFTVPANAMGTTRMARLKILAARLSNTGLLAEAAPTFRVYTGGTVRYADAAVALGNNASWSSLWIELLFAMQNANNVMYFNGLIHPQSVQGGATTGIGNAANAAIDGDAIGPVAGATFTQDTSVAWALRVTWQNGTNNANVIFRRQYAVLELL